MKTIPSGQCQCGCGKPAPIARCSSAARGWVKGEPLRFIRGHMGGINAAKAYAAKVKTNPDGSRTKWCTWCERQRPLADFGKGTHSRLRLRSHCKECNREQARGFYKKNPAPFLRRARIQVKKMRERLRARIQRIKEAYGCRTCGERDTCCLDFHHLLGKDRHITGCGTLRQFERELVKCVVVCASCHRKAHAGRLLISTDLLCQASDGRLNDEGKRGRRENESDTKSG